MQITTVCSYINTGQAHKHVWHVLLHIRTTNHEINFWPHGHSRSASRPEYT